MQFATDTLDMIPTLRDIAESRALSPLRSPSRVTELAPIDAPSYAEQIAAAGLGWTVSKAPLYGPDGCVWPGAYGVRRDDTGAPLGVVGARYTPAQNTGELADVLEAAFGRLPAQYRPRITHAASFRGGARVALSAQLPDEVSALLRVPRDESPMQARLSIMDSKDGGSSVQILPIAFRMSCENMLRAWHEAMGDNGLSVRHTASVVDVAARAERWIKEMASDLRVTGEMLRALDGRRLDSSTTTALVGEILEPDADKREETTSSLARKIGAVIELVETRDGIYVPAGEVTRYSVLQAVTAYARHRAPARGLLAEQSETRLERVISGDVVTSRAVEVLLAA